MPSEPEEDGQVGPVLLTAFEPFGGSAVNASLETARRIAATDGRFSLAVVPVVRGAAEAAALAALERTVAGGAPPRLMLSLGEAPVGAVHLEKVAINWDHYRIPDNAGNQPQDEPILPGGPEAHFATIPLVEVEKALAGRTPVPVRISLSAGAFLCNHLAYRLLHEMAEHPVCPYGFVHVPASRPGAGPSYDDLAATVHRVALHILRLTGPGIVR